MAAHVRRDARHHFNNELGGAEGTILEFGYHYDVLDRQDIQAPVIAQHDIAIKAKTEPTSSDLVQTLLPAMAAPLTDNTKGFLNAHHPSPRR